MLVRSGIYLVHSGTCLVRSGNCLVHSGSYLVRSSTCLVHSSRRDGRHFGRRDEMSHSVRLEVRPLSERFLADGTGEAANLHVDGEDVTVQRTGASERLRTAVTANHRLQNSDRHEIHKSSAGPCRAINGAP